jgi:hypothetical protein
MVFWMLSYLDGGLDVHVQQRRSGHGETEFLQHLAHPDNLASQAAMYSASVVDSATIDWRFDIQETTPVPIFTM